MVTISILYPHRQGARFDWDYYLQTHMPMSVGCLGEHPGFRSVSVQRGLGGAVSGAAPTYAALCIFGFESVDAFMAAFAPHAAALQGDMPRYTDIEPVLQFNEVLLSRSV